MMTSVLRHGGTIARQVQQRKIMEVAAELKNLLSGASIEIEDARVLVSGRGLSKRWLIDPALRFLAGKPK
jgi:hypothetical protein